MKKRKRVEKSQILLKNDIFNDFYFSLSCNSGLRVRKIEKENVDLVLYNCYILSMRFYKFFINVIFKLSPLLKFCITFRHTHGHFCWILLFW